MKNVTIHNAPILSINAGEHWLGIGAADNSMSLYHRPQERLGGFSSPGAKMAGWQLYRTPQRTVAVVWHYFSLLYMHILSFSLLIFKFEKEALLHSLGAQTPKILSPHFQF